MFPPGEPANHKAGWEIRHFWGVGLKPTGVTQIEVFGGEEKKITTK